MAATLKTLDPRTRPNFETEAELADLLWTTQQAIGRALAAVEEYGNASGDFHGGENAADSVLNDGSDVAWTMRELAKRLDRCVVERH